MSDREIDPRLVDVFRASKRWCDDLGTALRDESLMGATGFLYADGTLFIESTNNRHWAEQREAGCAAWYLRIGNSEELSDDLAALEARLANWADGEGYITEILLQQRASLLLACLHVETHADCREDNSVVIPLESLDRVRNAIAATR